MMKRLLLSILSLRVAFPIRPAGTWGERGGGVQGEREEEPQMASCTADNRQSVQPKEVTPMKYIFIAFMKLL